MSAYKIIAMHHAMQDRADNATVTPLDTLALELERLIGKQDCWEFATSLRTNDRAERAFAYQAKIANLTNPCDMSDTPTPGAVEPTYPMGWQETDRVRNEYAAFREAGGTYDNPPVKKSGYNYLF